MVVGKMKPQFMMIQIEPLRSAYGRGKELWDLIGGEKMGQERMALT